MMFGCFSKDETGIYKNLLQETAHRAGLDLPVYTSVRSGPGHIPTFSCTVELAGMSFKGESAKTKKQAEKNAAISAWFSLRKMPSLDPLRGEEKEQEVVARVLSRFRPKEVKRREPNQSRRRTVIRTIRQNTTTTTTTRDLLCEKLGSINLYTNKASSSSPSPSLPLPPRFWPSRTNLPQQESKVKSLLEKCQEYAERKQSPDYPIPKTEMIIKSSPLSSSLEKSYYSKLLPFSISGLNNQKLAPAVHIRSVIPVCSAPPPKPKPNPINPSSPSTTRELGIKSQEKTLRCKNIELGLESKSRSNP
ncbi:hypothetical protein CARUB_v10017714mg [Capsella rubella]|uniref:DRBM domain-containing protein n=1 Tax=Capsella rubella TaxID=81985 RepID=R0FQN0_9BRAS|nr:hypothetical protein CARUB_v10017714mg [Capsella rubella]